MKKKLYPLIILLFSILTCCESSEELDTSYPELGESAKKIKIETIKTSPNE